MEYKTLKTNFQRELLFFIILNLKRGKITKAYIKKVSKALLPVFKSETTEDFISGIERMCKYSPEVTDAFIRAVQEYEKETIGGKIENVRKNLMPNYSLSKGGE